ncbi:hypothetical protein BT69DRAFT_179643 [Atractiella rhizophila]|nr:hypothetical protein BT69DRAFT_179643 [Atractiella rhizophila]
MFVSDVSRNTGTNNFQRQAKGSKVRDSRTLYFAPPIRNAPTGSTESNPGPFIHAKQMELDSLVWFVDGGIICKETVDRESTKAVIDMLLPTPTSRKQRHVRTTLSAPRMVHKKAYLT